MTIEDQGAKYGRSGIAALEKRIVELENKLNQLAETDLTYDCYAEMGDRALQKRLTGAFARLKDLPTGLVNE